MPATDTGLTTCCTYPLGKCPCPCCLFFFLSCARLILFSTSVCAAGACSFLPCVAFPHVLMFRRIAGVALCCDRSDEYAMCGEGERERARKHGRVHVCFSLVRCFRFVFISAWRGAGVAGVCCCLSPGLSRLFPNLFTMER